MPITNLGRLPHHFTSSANRVLMVVFELIPTPSDDPIRIFPINTGSAGRPSCCCRKLRVRLACWRSQPLPSPRSALCRHSQSDQQSASEQANMGCTPISLTVEQSSLAEPPAMQFPMRLDIHDPGAKWSRSSVASLYSGSSNTDDNSMQEVERLQLS
jgi:hypothetical protein